MPTPPSSPVPANEAQRRAAAKERHRAILEELLDLAMDLARTVHHQAELRANDVTAPDPTPAFDRVARTVRRTVMLVHKLDEPAAAPRAPGAGPRAVTKPVEKMTDAELDELIEAEGLDRLDDDPGEDFDNRSVGELLAELARHAGIPPRPAAPGSPFRHAETSQPGPPPPRGKAVTPQPGAAGTLPAPGAAGPDPPPGQSGAGPP